MSPCARIHRWNSKGFSIIEAMMAVAIIGLSLGAMMTLNGHQLRMVKVSRDLNAATLYQQERVEQLRQARWPDLTSGTYLADTYMSTRPQSRMALNQISESIRVSAYPTAVMGSNPLKVAQTAGSAATIHNTENGFALTAERLVLVEMELAWKGADGRHQSRATSTLISNSGVTRSNLPALGPVSGGPWEPYNPADDGSGGDDGSGSGDSGSGDSGSGDSGSGDSGSGDSGSGDSSGSGSGGTGNGNGGGGNGNGRGNTGGKGGQK
jgi:Tfp pilus assembly protein PilV